MTVPNTAPKTTRTGVRLMPRVGIIVPDLEMLNHFKGIILNMPPQSTCVVTGWNPSSGNNAVAEFARSHGYITMSASQAYETGVRFNILVSHHTHVVPSSDILSDLGDTQVRLMYGLGKSEWNFSSWNKHYDAALCWGPYHARNLAERYPDSGADLPDLCVMAMAARRKARILTWDFRHFRSVVIGRGQHWRLLVEEHELPPAR